jgi:hypothetical protein
MTKLQDMGMVRVAGALIALVLVPLLVVSWRPDDGQSASELKLELVTVAGPGLALVPADRLLSVGKPEHGTSEDAPSAIVEVRNTTRRPVSVGVRLDGRPANASLDRLVFMRLEAQGKVLAEGNVADLRSWSPRKLDLPAAGGHWVAVRTWLASTASGNEKHGSLKVALQFAAHP